MKTVSEADLVALSRAAVKRFGLIAGGNAEGFLIDLDYALDEEIGLSKVKVKKTGEPDCRFRVTGFFNGDPSVVARRILDVLDERIGYAPDKTVAARVVDGGSIHVSLLTHSESIGAATVCISVRSV